MSFQVKFGSQSNLPECRDTDSRRGRGDGGGDPDSDESDDCSSVTSESRGGRRRGNRGGRGRARRSKTPGGGQQARQEAHHRVHLMQARPGHPPLAPRSGYRQPPRPNQPVTRQHAFHPAPVPAQTYPKHETYTLPSHGGRPPLLRDPTVDDNIAGVPFHRSPFQRTPEQTPAGKSAGPQSANYQNPKQKPPAKGGRGGDGGNAARGGDSKPKLTNKAGKGHRSGAKHQPDQEQQTGSSGTQNETPCDAGDDEWIKVFNLLLRQLNGRTKLGSLMSKSKKGGLFQGLSPPECAAWFKHHNRFLTYERDGYVKYVSVWFKEARCCFKYKKHGTDKCEFSACPFFHVCREYVAGRCPRGQSCNFNHSFHSRTNAKVCEEAGLQAFTDEEIRTIVFRSGPVACIRFNQGKCQEDDCPDVHVCVKHLRGECPAGADCRIGHKVRGPEHNDWILQTFHMTHITENTLCKLIVAPKVDSDGNETSGGRQDSPNSTIRADKDEKRTEKAPGMKKWQTSEEDRLNLTETAVPKGRGMTKGRSLEGMLHDAELALPTPDSLPSDADALAKKRQRNRKRKDKNEANDQDVSLSSRLEPANVQQPPPAETPPWTHAQKAEVTRSTGHGSELHQHHQPRYIVDSDLISSPALADTQQQQPLVAKPRDRAEEPNVRTWREGQSGHNQRRHPFAEAVAVDAASVEGRGEGLQHSPACHYTHLCEQHSATGTCSQGYLCPRFHHPDRLLYVWQIRVFNEWWDFSPGDNLEIEERFRNLATNGVFQVFLDTIGGLELWLDFQKMTAEVRSSISEKHHVGFNAQQILSIRRWSTPSYVEADDSTPLHLYTQWCWYREIQDNELVPFDPATLQYTLEEKFIHEQHRYYFEDGEVRYLLLMVPDDLVLVNLNEERNFRVFRRPSSDSTLLLREKPVCQHVNLPPTWSTVDRHQDFELVEMENHGPEYQEVVRSFHSTMSRDAVTILRVFRIQNPSLWDKYCSTRRSMTPRYRSELKDVDERKLFHGTPTLLAARGICANNVDFRRSGQNVGSLFGKGSYFSAHALYSNAYTTPPDRYMFLARVLVGKYTRGQPTFTAPPVREGVKLYDSCVNDEVAPTIFVIFDLAQSYPEYLIQFHDEPGDREPGMGSGSSVPASRGPGMGSGSSVPASRGPGVGSGLPVPGSQGSGMGSGLPVPASQGLGIGSGLYRPGSGVSGSTATPGPAAAKAPVPAPRRPPVPAPRTSTGLQAGFPQRVPVAQEAEQYFTFPQPAITAQMKTTYKKTEKKSKDDRCVIS